MKRDLRRKFVLLWLATSWALAAPMARAEEDFSRLSAPALLQRGIESARKAPGYRAIFRSGLGVHETSSYDVEVFGDLVRFSGKREAWLRRNVLLERVADGSWAPPEDNTFERRLAHPMADLNLMAKTIATAKFEGEPHEFEGAICREIVCRASADLVKQASLLENPASEGGGHDKKQSSLTYMAWVDLTDGRLRAVAVVLHLVMDPAKSFAGELTVNRSWTFRGIEEIPELSVPPELKRRLGVK